MTHDATAPADPMLAKIRKLLAKAEDSATTPAEAELYTAKAAQLIADYGIDEALLAHRDPSRDPVGDRVVVLDAPYAADKADLLGAISAELRCRAVRRTRYPEGAKEISLHLFGHQSDLQRVELLFTSLLLQTAQGLARTPVPPRENKAAFRRSWMAGFTRAIAQRLAVAEREAEAHAADRFRSSGTTAALVLADRSALVHAAMNDEYPHRRSGRRRQLSGSGMRDGWSAGQRADLGGTRIGERATRALH